MRKGIHKYRDLDFDEVVSDSLSASELNSLERPLRPAVFQLFLIITVLAAVIFGIKIFILAGINHENYLKRAEANINQEIPLIAPRGIILDRSGTPLVENQAIFSVFLHLNTMIKNDEKGKVLEAAEQILGLKRDEVINNWESANFEDINNIILERDISREQAIAIKSLGLKSLTVENDYRREYNNPAFSHITGYVGLVSKSDLRKNQDFVLNDLIGRAGLESYYDNLLRGQNGAIGVFRNAEGRVESITRTKEPLVGNNLETSIDAELQKYFYQRMIQGLVSLGRTSGAGIAINPKTGEVLALISLPSFDANDVAPYLNASNRPLFNRAVSGLYSPGSTIKPIHAAAALEEGVVDTKKQVYSAGYIEIPNPYDASRPSRFLDWKAHGWVNLYSALARSSNVYFYAVGGGFGDIKGVRIDKLIKYWQRFGLDKKTGIDLPGENEGFLPSPEEKEKRTGQIWRIGDTYNVSIGQGDLLISPLELISAVGAIANHGKAYVPHLAKNQSPQDLIDVTDLEPSLKEVRQGMEDAVVKSYGTANLLSGLPIGTAGKTGSAQTAGNTKINAMFVGYAPTDDPQIAILILIEDAREGSLNTIPIAKDVLEWYYNNRLSR